MKELTERLRVLRTSGKLDGVFGDRPSTAEFKKSCASTQIGYSKI